MTTLTRYRWWNRRHDGHDVTTTKMLDYTFQSTSNVVVQHNEDNEDYVNDDLDFVNRSHRHRFIHLYLPISLWSTTACTNIEVEDVAQVCMVF